MATKRTNFSDAQKAEIYARDRATCCFTGANLWLLESPVRPGFEQDWVDHIKPSTRGGKSVISNGVCASATYNAKKGQNTSDSVYLFRSGVPTDVYFGLFGTLPEAQRERLNRLSGLRAYDWYFNRAIALVCIGFEWRCWKKYYQTVYKRDDRYWINAAYKKLCIYQELGRDSSLLDRGLAT